MLASVALFNRKIESPAVASQLSFRAFNCLISLTRTILLLSELGKCFVGLVEGNSQLGTKCFKNVTIV